jgi:hypothetical protein
MVAKYEICYEITINQCGVSDHAHYSKFNNGGENMRVQDFSDKNLDRIMTEINYNINLLYIIPCVYTRNLILNHLRDRIPILESVMKAMGQPVHL